MNGGSIKGVIYLLFIATIFYFIVGKIFKIVKFNKFDKLKKGIYFSIFILLFYFFYKVIPVLLFGNNRVTEGMSLADSLTGAKSSDSDGSSGNIDYTKGWDTADNFRDAYCSKNPIFVDAVLFEKDTGNDSGGLVYGLKSELYNKETKKTKQEYIDAYLSQIKKRNRIDSNSFTKDNDCITNLKADNGASGTMTQMCFPKCNFKFTSASK